MNYEINTIPNSDGNSYDFIKQEIAENTFRTFRADNSDSYYISFLRQLSQENPDDPHYQEWLSQGNNPEEFWAEETE